MADRYRPLTERFWEKVRKGDGCWEWLGARCEPGGYGRIRLDGAQLLAHRVAYEINVGAIPDDLTIDHLCGNRWCVNPEHLEQRLARALFQVDSTHHFGFGDDGLTCLCGYEGNARKRTQTEHITAAVLEAFDDD